jgi:hypothetical protein
MAHCGSADPAIGGTKKDLLPIGSFLMPSQIALSWPTADDHDSGALIEVHGQADQAKNPEENDGCGPGQCDLRWHQKTPNR